VLAIIQSDTDDEIEVDEVLLDDVEFALDDEHLYDI
jgi:hypothetical protein